MGGATRAAQAGTPIVARGPVDFRLAVGAVAAWLGALFGLGRSAGAAVLLGVLGAVVGIAGVLSARRWPALSAVALAGFGLALVLLPLAARTARSHDSPLAQLGRARVAVTVEIRVTSDPRLLAAKGVAGSPRAAVDARVDSALVAGRPVSGARGAVLVLGPAALWRDVLPGQRVRLDALAQPPLGRDLLAATLLAQSDPMPVGSPPWWQSVAGRVRSSLRESAAGLPEQPRGLLPGLIDGDTSGLDPVLAERFRIAGLTHLVAVSGVKPL